MRRENAQSSASSFVHLLHVETVHPAGRDHSREVGQHTHRPHEPDKETLNWQRRHEEADATKMNERSGNVYENKGRGQIVEEPQH